MMSVTSTSSTTDDVITDALDAITECFVCGKVIDDATSLPCIHPVCSGCLGAGEQLNSSSESCPVCGKIFPRSDIRADTFIQDLVDGQTSPRTSSKTVCVYCDFCAEEQLEQKEASRSVVQNHEPGTLATMHCLDCRKKLCTECCRGHRRHCRNHVIVDIDDVIQRRRSLARSTPRCRRHDDETLKIFCCECRLVLCVLCYAEGHHTHPCKDVGNVAAEFQRQLKDDRQWMDVYAAGLTTGLTQLENDWRSFETSTEETRLKIRERGELIKRAVDDHVTKLTRELETITQVRFKEFTSSKKAVNGLLNDVDFLKKYILVLTELGNPCHITDRFHLLQRKAGDLKVVRQPLNGFSKQRIKVDFSNSEHLKGLVSEEETSNVLGRLSLVDISDDTLEKSQDNQETFTELLGTVDTDGRGVTGVTMLNNKLYIVCAWTNTVLVHESKPPFTKSSTILVKDMRCPNDIASCTDNSCLYVVDADKNCVWKITVLGHSERWIGKAGQPWTISVNRGRVLLASEGKPPQLNIYGPGAGILHRVRLPSAITAVQHAVELDEGNFIVSHGRNSGHSNRICEISSKSGNVVRYFDGLSDPKGSATTGLIRWPKHVAINGEKSVLVAEFSNHYVLVLNRELKLERILLSWDKDKIDAPSRLCYVPGTGILLLAEAASVKVYFIEGLRSQRSIGSESSGRGSWMMRPELFEAQKS